MTGTVLTGLDGEREVWRIEIDGVIHYSAYRLRDGVPVLQTRFSWTSGEEDQVRQWLEGGPDPE